MPPEERLQQRRCDFHEMVHQAIDAVLFQSEPPEDALPWLPLSRSLACRLAEATQAYQMALLDAAHSTGQEIAEDYRKQAQELPSQTAFLLPILLEHRRRKTR